MKKRALSLLAALILGLLLLPLTASTAYAEDYDRILSYTIVAEPNVEDGSITFTAAFNWKTLEELPYDPSHTDTENRALKIGIPNGAIREVKILSGDIEHLTNDNSFMYIFMDHTCAAGETFSFSYSWVQEYMYTLGEDGSVTYDYTPGWFDGAKTDKMMLAWKDPAGMTSTISASTSNNSLWSRDGGAFMGKNLGHGHKINVQVRYDSWPTALEAAHSIGNIPEQYSNGGDFPFTAYRVVSTLIRIVIIMVFVFCVINALSRTGRRSYSGGFGTHYVFFNNLWYPAGPDGKPKPGSTGTVHKPKPPSSGSSSGGFGGGKRGGGFGGGGFGGGSRCACASSCACACACACAGGGRAGCSAKNLYGAVLLDEAMSRKLMEDEA